MILKHPIITSLRVSNEEAGPSAIAVVECTSGNKLYIQMATGQKRTGETSSFLRLLDHRLMDWLLSITVVIMYRAAINK